MYSFSYLEPACCSISSSNCCFLTCIQIFQKAGQVVWYSHLNRYFCKEDIQMDKKHVKRCSTLLIIREMQIKTIVKYHFTLVRMAIIKKSTNNKCWRGCIEREPSYTVGGNIHWYNHYREQYGVSLKKLKIELPCYLTIPLLGIYPEKTII